MIVVDVVGTLTNSQNPRHYWIVLKLRLKQQGSELVTFYDQLKLKSLVEKEIKNKVITTGEKNL